MKVIDERHIYVSKPSTAFSVTNKKTEVIFSTEENHFYKARSEFINTYMSVDKDKREVYRMLSFRRIAADRFLAVVEHTVYH